MFYAVMALDLWVLLSVLDMEAGAKKRKRQQQLVKTNATRKAKPPVDAVPAI